MLSRENYPQAAHFYYLEALKRTGCVVLNGRSTFPEGEYRSLRYDSELPRMTWPESEGFGIHFASIASFDGDLDVRPFGTACHKAAEKDGRWTENAKKCPMICEWVRTIGGNYGAVRVLKKSNDIRKLHTIEDARRLYHRDTTNLYSAPGDGWIVRLLVELTDDPASYLFTRTDRDDAATERRISLSAGLRVLFDADQIWHTVWHPGTSTRYALLVSLESSKLVSEWVEEQGWTVPDGERPEATAGS